MGGVYYPSINNKFKGRIKYGKDFVEMLEKELSLEYSYDGDGLKTRCFFPIEGKIYMAKASFVKQLSNEDNAIGSCFNLCLGERRSHKEISEIISKNDGLLSKNIIIRYFQMRDYNRIRAPDWIWIEHRKTKERQLLEEINAPRRVAHFTVIQEEDEDDAPVYKGQRIVPRRLTHTRMQAGAESGHQNEFTKYSKDELKNYPIVDMW